MVCHIEREKKRKQTSCRVNSHHSRLTCELRERKKERMKERKASFVGLLKERKHESENESKKERIKWFVACHIERERKRKQTSCWESKLTSKRNGFFSFWVRLLGYVSFESTLTTRKREKERVFTVYDYIKCNRHYWRLYSSIYIIKLNVCLSVCLSVYRTKRNKNKVCILM